MLTTQKNHLIQLLSEALKQTALAHGLSPTDIPVPQLERPKSTDHGDVACNIAMQVAKLWQLKPRDLAQTLISHLTNQANYADFIAAAEVAGPGFINFRLTNQAKTAGIKEI